MSSTEFLLGSLSKIIDCEHKTAPESNGEIYAYSVGTRALSLNTINLSACKPVDEETYKSWSKRGEIEVGDIILAREAPVGGVGLVKSINPKYCLGQRTVLIKPDREVINPTYLSYLMQSAEIQDWFSDMSTGSTVLHLNVGDIKKLPLRNLPTLKIQSHVADILSNIELKIEVNRSLSDSLEDIAQTLFKAWFIDFDPVKAKMTGEKPAGMDDATAALFPDTMEESELGFIPKGWEVRKIESLCETLLGGTPSRTRDEFWGGKIPWINSGKVNDFRITAASEYITELGLEKSATKLLPKGTTVLAITGATLGQFSRLEIATCANQSVVGIVGSAEASNEFIYLNIKNGIQRLISAQTGGAQQHINKEDVNAFLIVFPGKKLMNAFTDVVDGMFAEIGVLLNQSISLTEIRDSLLPRLISGKLEIPEEMLAS
jgi:type I restriction enzyme S subunit